LTIFLLCTGILLIILFGFLIGQLDFFAFSVADPDPGSGAFFNPWIREPGWVKSQDPDRG
jgi:hypothetical protein